MTLYIEDKIGSTLLQIFPFVIIDKIEIELKENKALHIRVLEEPLTAQNLSIAIAAITDLYTRCLLFLEERFTDLMDYAQTRDPRFVKEANLQVGAMTHNSPAIIDLLLN